MEWNFNETRYVSFLIKDDKLLKKYNEIWEKVTSIIYKELYTMKNIQKIK